MYSLLGLLDMPQFTTLAKAMYGHILTLAASTYYIDHIHYAHCATVFHIAHCSFNNHM